MLTNLRRHLTYANVVSTLCLFILLGGSAFAAVRLSKNSVRSKHIKNEQVQSVDVKNASLLPQDFAPGQLPRGEKGEKGDTGAPGEPAAALWAMVNSNGTVKRGRGVVDVDLSGTSQYNVTFDRSVANCTYLSTLTEADNDATGWLSPPEGQSNAASNEANTGEPTDVVVETANSAGAAAAFDFNLAVFC